MQSGSRFAWLLVALVGLAMSLSLRAAEPDSRIIDVSGDLVIAPDGSVRSVTLAESTAPGVAKLVQAAVQRWRFEPVMRDGVPVAAKTGMQLLLATTEVEGGFRLRIDKVLFVNARSKPLRYVVPGPTALTSGHDIDVLAALRVDDQGNVAEVAVLSIKFGKGNNPFVRTSLTKDLKSALKRSKFRPADAAAGERGDDTFYVPLSYLGTRGEHRLPTVAERFDDAIPVPWLPADQQPKLMDLPDGKGQPVGLASGIRLTESVVGTTL